MLFERRHMTAIKVIQQQEVFANSVTGFSVSINAIKARNCRFDPILAGKMNHYSKLHNEIFYLLGG